MWLFEKGALGTVIVVLSLAASLLFGVVVNINSETVERNVPEYVSDITGLYAGESDQTYVDYNPSANFNGYDMGESTYNYPNSGTRIIQTVTPHAEGTTYIDGNNIPHYFVNTDIVYTPDIFYIGTNEPTTLYHDMGSVTATQFGPFLRSTATTWVWGAITLDADQFRCIGTGNTLYSIQWKQAASLSVTTAEFSLPQNSVVKITDNNTITYVPITAPKTMNMSNGNVTIGSTTYTYTDVAVATLDTTITYTQAYSTDDRVNDWYTKGSYNLNLTTYTMSDIVSIITNSETNNGVIYGRVALKGSITASDGVNSYACTYADPFVFFRSGNGWVGNIGDMADFTFTNSSTTSISYWTYNTRDFTGNYDVDFTITTPMGFALEYGGSSWSSPDRQTEYYFAEPVNGHITFSSVGDFSINGTVYLQDVVRPRVKFVTTDWNNDVGNADWPYRYDYTYYTQQTASLNDFNTSTISGTVLNQHNISYGNGIPDDQQYAFYKIVCSETCTLTDATGTMSGQTFGTYYANSDTSWKWASRTANTTHFSIAGSASAEYTVTAIGFTQIVIPYDYTLTVPAGNTVVKMDINGTNTYLHITTQFTIVKASALYTINGTDYNNVDAIYVSTFDPEELTYTAVIKDYPVEFKPSSTGNNYKFSYDTESTINRAGVLSTYPIVSYSYLDTVYKYEGSVPIMVYPSDGNTYTGHYYAWTGAFYEVSLKTILDTEETYARTNMSSVKEITLDFPITVITGTVSDQVVGLNTWTVSYKTVDNPIMIAPYSTSTISSFPYTYDSLSGYNNGDVIHLRCVFDLENRQGVVYYNTAAIYTFDDSSVGDYRVIYPYESHNQDNPGIALARYVNVNEITPTQYDSSFSLPDVYINSTNAMTISYKSDETYSYLDARYGVNVRNGEQISWQNGYSNEAITMIALLGTAGLDGVVTPDLTKDYMTTWEFTYGNTIPSQTPQSSRSSMKMVHQANGPTTFYFDDYGSPAYTYEFGNSWVGFSINVNGVTGKVSIAPISSVGWTSFLVNTPENAIPMDYTLRFKNDITGMVISVPGDMSGGVYTYEPVRFQVMDSRVFLNTYGVIKVDASLNIQAYYPLNEKYMISIHDTAAVGSAITIGGTTYIVEDNRITIDGTIIDVSEMELSYYKQPNELYTVDIYSPKNDSDITLSDVSDTTLAFAGAWYFESDYYKIELKEVEEYFWHPESLGYGYTGVVLFMMIFLGAISIIWWKVRPETLGALDIAIIIGAEIILFIILV